MNKTYAVIDLKSFYASVECVDRGKDPFTYPLVVADISRGKNAICLAVSPALKKLGVPGRVRIQDIPSKYEYEAAKPRMKLYMEKSAEIYGIYLKYFSENDIHIYSIDECFIDYTDYLPFYKMDAVALTKMVLKDIYDTLGLTATCGIGTNMFLAKIALDIEAKKSKDGIAYLDEDIFKKNIWHHKPITDIWRIGKGTANRLAKYGIKDLYDITKTNEKLLYREFGKNAFLLIDHAYGKESCSIKDIKEYTPKTMSLSNSQILFSDYTKEDAKTVLIEMIDNQILEMVNLSLQTSVVSVGVKSSKQDEKILTKSIKLNVATNSFNKLKNIFLKLYDELVPNDLKIRQLFIAFEDLSYEGFSQLSFLPTEKNIIKENKAQKAAIKIKQKFGKNAILRGTSLKKEATGISRNKMIGGHAE